MKVAQGLNNRKIGLDLALNERTVKRHMTNLMRKLKVRNRVEAPLKVHTK